jgi:hypothetical protein
MREVSRKRYPRLVWDAGRSPLAGLTLGLAIDFDVCKEPENRLGLRRRGAGETPDV